MDESDLEDDQGMFSDENFVLLDKTADKEGVEKRSLYAQAEAAWRLLNSGVLLPDSLKGNPYVRPILFLLAAFFIILPVKLYLILIFAGLLIGLILNPVFDRESQALNVIRARFQQIDQLSFAEALEKSPSSSLNTGGGQLLSLSKDIDSALDIFLDRLVISLIDPWFMPQNKSGQREFQSCVRSTLDAALANLKGTISALNKDSMTLYIYGLTNALNVHMQEFKAFSKSGKDSSKDFLLSNEALRTFYPSMMAEVGHFRQLVAIILKKLLPRQEARSIIVVSLLKEVISSGAFYNAMDRICDPDFINMKIVEALKEPTDLSGKIEPGWSLVVVKVIKGKDLPIDNADGGLYCMIHVAGRKVRTRRISNSDSPIWNESFQFKVSDNVLRHLKLHVQLLKYSYMGQDTNLGYSNVLPEIVSSPADAKQMWLKFKIGEVFIETFVLSQDSTTKLSPIIRAQDLTSSNVSIPQAEVKKEVDLSIKKNYDIDAVLKNNELFMEFYEFLNEFKAPPYLQFFMNYDAARQFTAMELGVDPNIPEAIDNYFKWAPLTPAQKDQLKVIKMDAMDLFNSHFFAANEAKYAININQDLLDQMRLNLKSSDKMDEAGRYIGEGPIGPNIFIPVYKWIYGVLKDVYFDKFKESERFQRYTERSQFSTSQFTFEDDTTSVFTAETSTQLNKDMVSTSRGVDDICELNESIEEGGRACDDAEMDIKKISTAISILKQQLAVIEDKLESCTDLDREVQLKQTKKDLEKQVASMLNLIRSRESGIENPGEDFWLDLRNVTIKVRLSDQNTESTSSLWSNNPVFDIEVIRDSAGESMTLSVVSKTFLDFEVLHKVLKKEFPKLSKITFHSVSDPDLASSLEGYLLLLISDEFIRQSHVLREFVSLDSDLEGKTLASSASNLVEAVVGKRVKSALQTATSILSVGMISSGKSKKSSHFYETREHHTTSDLATTSGEERVSDVSLLRSRSISSFTREEPKEPTVSPTIAKSVPATPVKASAKLEAPTGKPSKLALNSKSASPQIFSIEEFTESEMDMLMETVYTFVTETFDLREPNQWIRRKVLSVSKQLLKQAYGDTLSKTMSKMMNDSLKEDAILKGIEGLTKLLWPNGIFIKDVPPPNRSADQQLATQIEARALFLNKIPDTIEKMAGRYNAINGMTRIFNLLQQKDFNKLLFITAIDITVKILFTEQAN